MIHKLRNPALPKGIQNYSRLLPALGRPSQLRILKPSYELSRGSPEFPNTNFMYLKGTVVNRTCTFVIKDSI